MNDQEIDSKVRDYFLGCSLPLESVNRIVELGAAEKPSTRSQRRSSSIRYWLPVAAAAALVVVASFQFGKNAEENDYFFDVAGQIVMRHNDVPESAFKVVASDFEGVQKGLSDLSFSVIPSIKEGVLSTYEILGARYCQIEGQQAAHLRVRNRKTGAFCTLFVTSLKGPLESLRSVKEHAVELPANKVDIWRDSGRLFALVD